MKFTDPGVILFLKKANLPEVAKRIDDYPEGDVDGRSDWQMLADEASWVMSEYHSGESSLSEQLADAKRTIAANKRGISFSSGTIRECRNSINEYNRLSRFILRLKAKGYTGRW